MMPSTHTNDPYTQRARPCEENAEFHAWFEARHLRLVQGNYEDYQQLAHHHYRAGRPATIARSSDGSQGIRSLRDRADRLAGVLIVSMPTLNSSWRSLAWPGRFNTGDKSRDAQRINRELRCISRVIIDPRYRSMGLASHLVGAYLNCPMTPLTEAVAAMGRVCPFFKAAGMKAFQTPPTLRDAKWLDALASVGLEPWELLDIQRAEDALCRHPWLLHQARQWAKGSRTTRQYMHNTSTTLSGPSSACKLIMLAAAHAAHRPVAYAHANPKVMVLD